MTSSTPFRSATRKLFLAVILVFSFSFTFSQPISTYWKYVNPGPMGNHFLDVVYVNDLVGYGCGDAGVIARTTDGGHTWTYDYIRTREALNDIQFLDERTGFAVGGNGRVIKTSNRGITWDTVAVKPSNANLTNVFFFDANTGIVVGDPLGGSATIFKTTNGGASWTSLASAFPVQNKSIVSVKFLNASVGYVSGSSGLVAKTNDGGLTWTNISLIAGNPYQATNAGGTCYTQYFQGLAVLDPQTVVISSLNNSFIVKTIDGGQTWVIKASQSALISPLSIIPGSFQMRSIAVKESNLAVSMGSMVGISKDRGETWKISKPFPFSSVSGYIQYNGIAITPNNSIKLLGMYGIAADSVSGGPGWDTSYYKNINYNPVQAMNALAVSHLDKNNVLIGGTNGQIFKSTDGGVTWIDKTIPEFAPPLYVPVAINDIKYVAANAAYMACGNGYVYRSLDGGLTWPDPYAYNTFRYVTGIDFTDANTGWAAATNFSVGSNAVFRTTNGGLNWTMQTSPFANARELNAIDFVNNTTGWVVGANTVKIFKTTDGGVNWTPQTHPATFTGTLYSVSFANVDTGFACGSGGKVIRTFDGGATWTDVSPVGLAGIVNKVVFVNGKTGVVFGSGGACYKTTDAGNTWTYFGGPTNDVLANACVIAPYSTINDPGGANVDMMVVGGRQIGGLSPTVYKVRVIDAAAPPLFPIIINVSDKCPNAPTAKGKILNPPVYSQIDITVDGTPVLYYPNDSSFIYYEKNITVPGLHAVRVRFTTAAGTIFKDTSYNYYATNMTPLVGISSDDADLIVCSGQTLNFHATPIAYGGTNPSYQWSVNMINAGTSTDNFSYIPKNGDVVQVIMTSSFACVTNPKVLITAGPIEVPNFNPVLKLVNANTITLVSPDTGASYQWFKDGQPIPGATGTSYKITGFGTFTVQEVYHTCSKLSNSISIGGAADDITVFPVPVTTILYAKTGTASAQIQKVSIYDANGQLILTRNFSNSNLVEVDLAKLPAGLYMAKFETSSSVITKKIVKQ